MNKLVISGKDDVKKKNTPTKNILRTHKKIEIPQDLEYKKLVEMCEAFVNHKIQISAKFSFDEEQTPISNCNAVGDILEDIFCSRFKKIIQDMEVGPKQTSPDFWTQDRKFEYEMKAFMVHPSFDVANFGSYVSQLSADGGLFRKLFRTKYLIFEYEVNENVITIKNFWSMNVWNIVGYNGKYPIGIQNKRNMWYNMRPSYTKEWNTKSKTPELFVGNMIKAIKECPNQIDDRDKIITNIQNQFDNIKLKYNI